MDTEEEFEEDMEEDVMDRNALKKQSTSIVDKGVRQQGSDPRGPSCSLPLPQQGSDPRGPSCSLPLPQQGSDPRGPSCRCSAAALCSSAAHASVRTLLRHLPKCGTCLMWHLPNVAGEEEEAQAAPAASG